MGLFTCSFNFVPKMVVLSSLKQSILLAMLHLFARYLNIFIKTVDKLEYWNTSSKSPPP